MAVKEMTKEDKTTIINELITDSCCWEEEDREELVAMTENQLSKTRQAAVKQTENDELLTAAEAGFNDDRDSITFNQEKRAWERVTKSQKDDEGEEVKNKEKKTEEVIAQLSAEDQEVLNYGRRMMDQERKGLIDHITKNVGDDAKPEAVANFSKRSMEDLRQVADLMPQDTVPGGQRQDYYGGQPPADLSIENEELDGEPLIPEDLDFVANSSFKKE